MVFGDGICQLCEQYRFTHLRRRNNHAPLAFADGRNKVNNPAGKLPALCFQTQLFFRINGCQFFEIRAFCGILRFIAVYGLHKQQRTELFPLSGRADIALYCITRFQAETANLGRGNINIVCAGQEIICSQKTEAVRHNLQYALPDRAVFHQLIFLGRLRPFRSVCSLAGLRLFLLRFPFGAFLLLFQRKAVSGYLLYRCFFCMRQFFFNFCNQFAFLQGGNGRNTHFLCLFPQFREGLAL